MTLRDDLQEYLEGWRSDLSPAWRRVFDGVEPDPAAFHSVLLSDTAFPVIPGRRGAPRPGARADAHVFRAFDGLSPEAVSVVVVGEDPYPSVARATGRAFEDGALAGWDGDVASSLKRLMRSAVADRCSRPDLDWRQTKELLLRGDEPPRAYFDRLEQAHGVLFVNAAWTFTRRQDQNAHIAMWRPLMHRLMGRLTEPADRRLMFLLLGDRARRLFRASGVKKRRFIDAVEHPHPKNRRGAYSAEGNPLTRVNEALSAMGAGRVSW